MGFRTLNLKSTYSSDEEALLPAFYLPVLNEAISYDRAVGYFSSETLSMAMQGADNFIRHGGVMRLVIGYHLNDEEYEAVKRGQELKSKIARLSEGISLVIKECDENLLKHRLRLLSWLVAYNRLSIKIAIKKNGMYHDKIGVLTDVDGNEIVFHGSANETINALTASRNSESINVFPSWKPEVYTDYGMQHKRRFEALWEGDNPQAIVVDLPSEDYDKLRAYYSELTPPEKLEEAIYSNIELIGRNFSGLPSLPKTIGTQPYKLKEHQRNALDLWKESSFVGIFALATGAGKTITALHGATKLFEKMDRSVIVVAVPYRVLAEQWVDQMKLFGMNPVKCYDDKAGWLSAFQSALAAHKSSDGASCVSVVVVNKTLKSEPFQRLISQFHKNEIIFIGDECHHHANAQILEKLPNASYRVGLSATPWRYNDEQSRHALCRYYGGVVAEYSLSDALSDGVLSAYDYEAYEVFLDHEELEDHDNISSKIAQLVAIKENGSDIDESYLMSLYLKRGRVIGSAKDKMRALDELLKNRVPKKHTLFYCGDGSVEGEVLEGSALGSASPERDIERLSKRLSLIGWKTSQFTAKESPARRHRILDNFVAGYIEGLVAIRVLDEGFDVPACNEAFLLASSRNERQFIQRRGRVLRKDGQGGRARIIDFLVLPEDPDCSSYQRDMVQYELRRAYEFGRHAENKEKALGKIEDISERYDVNISSIKEEVENWRYT